MESQYELEELIDEAKKQVHANPSAEQVIIVKTVKGNVHCCVNNVFSANFEDENRFLQKLLDEDDVEMKYIVCMWNNYGVEIPSMNFRKGLLDACAKNAEAMMLLQIEDSLQTRELKWSMP